MSLLGWFTRWRMRFQIGLILFLRYVNPWDSFFRHPIVFDIWLLAMNSESIAEMVDQELLGPGDVDDADAALLSDVEDAELAEVLAAAGTTAPARPSGGPIRASPRLMNAHVQRWRDADLMLSRPSNSADRKKKESKDPGVSSFPEIDISVRLNLDFL